MRRLNTLSASDAYGVFSYSSCVNVPSGAGVLSDAEEPGLHLAEVFCTSIGAASERRRCALPGAGAPQSFASFRDALFNHLSAS